MPGRGPDGHQAGLDHAPRRVADAGHQRFGLADRHERTAEVQRLAHEARGGAFVHPLAGGRDVGGEARQGLVGLGRADVDRVVVLAPSLSAASRDRVAAMSLVSTIGRARSARTSWTAAARMRSSSPSGSTTRRPRP